MEGADDYTKPINAKLSVIDCQTRWWANIQLPLGFKILNATVIR
jgi:hypothetical protein